MSRNTRGFTIYLCCGKPYPSIRVWRPADLPEIIIDESTRYVLAARLTKTRSKRAIQATLEEAAQCAGRNPAILRTDNLNVYPEAIDAAYGSDTRHLSSEGFGSKTNTNVIERWHGSLKDRIKTLRGMQDMKTAYAFLKSWIAYYNYLRPHESLNDKTPSERAGLKPRFTSFDAVTRQRTTVATVTLEVKPPKFDAPMPKHIRDTMTTRQFLGPRVRITPPRPHIPRW